MNTWVARAMSVTAAALLAVTGLVTATPAKAASNTVSTRYLVHYLPGAPEHVAGYDRAKFRLWSTPIRTVATAGTKC